MLINFNVPESRTDIPRLIYYALHQALADIDVHVVHQGDSVELQWSDDAPDDLEDGHVVFLPASKYYKVAELLRR
jgi:hypothetical protein